LTPIFGESVWPPGKNGFGYGGAVRLDSSSTTAPGPAGVFRWAGYGSTFFWVDPQNKLIAMLWSQFIPVTEMWALDAEYQQLVYAALARTSTASAR